MSGPPRGERGAPLAGETEEIRPRRVGLEFRAPGTTGRAQSDRACRAARTTARRTRM